MNIDKQHAVSNSVSYLNISLTIHIKTCLILMYQITRAAYCIAEKIICMLLFSINPHPARHTLLFLI